MAERSLGKNFCLPGRAGQSWYYNFFTCYFMKFHYLEPLIQREKDCCYTTVLCNAI